ncbi:DUF2922 domain-containing protein [Lutispora thermophila]|uniref:DUF2922 domain-containing protein n=1 Tax=Lutispora thermophila DSM 19022 TaxID=1122184 RepID=A0A1M6APG0_9FIRM|nr:DUF2922 domain-containing protein [Lutispora thermophila]SHI38380.1 Protein of unknown function [Lutispora thermophila DSM 19022]
MARKLEMVFRDALGKIMKISVDNADENLTADSIKSAMESIISKNVFATETGDLIAIDGARIVDTNIQKLDFE